MCRCSLFSYCFVLNLVLCYDDKFFIEKSESEKKVMRVEAVVVRKGSDAVMSPNPGAGRGDSDAVLQHVQEGSYSGCPAQRGDMAKQR